MKNKQLKKNADMAEEVAATLLKAVPVGTKGNFGVSRKEAIAAAYCLAYGIVAGVDITINGMDEFETIGLASEILTYALEGLAEHRDEKLAIKPGECNVKVCVGMLDD